MKRIILAAALIVASATPALAWHDDILPCGSGDPTCVAAR